MIGEDLIRQAYCDEAGVKPYKYLLFTSKSFFSRCSVDIGLQIQTPQADPLSLDCGLSDQVGLAQGPQDSTLLQK